MADEKTTFTKEELDAEVAGLKANKDEAIKEARKAKERLAAYDGVDVDEYKKLKAQAAEAEQKKAEASGNFEALKKQLIDQHTAEKQSLEKRNAKFETALSKRLKQDELRRALTGKALPEYTELLLEHGVKYLGIRETDDDFEQFVHDGKGNPRVSDGVGTQMSIDAFVEQDLKTRFPGAFMGTGSSGGGATKSTAGGGGSSKTVTDGQDFLRNISGIVKGEVQVKTA